MTGADVYAIVTERITEALEAGVIPWRKPWVSTGLPRNLITKREYRGMNVLLLSLGQPYASPYWLTFKQAKDLRGSVRRGEKASIVTFWKFPEAKDEEDERRAPILRYYHVFNVEQCEGITAPAPEGVTLHPHEKIGQCEGVVSAMPNRPEIKRDGARAYYAPALDYVGMPPIEQFATAEAYYSVLFHELTHSTGHPSRLNRPGLTNLAPFGSPDYSREELVAEFGAAFLCGHTGIFPATAGTSASYIDGWLRALKQDRRLLPIAAGQAQRAADYILGNAPAGEAAWPRGAAGCD